MLSLSPCNSGLAAGVTECFLFGSIWKIAETEGKTEGRETQQHQQGQPLLTALTALESPGGAFRHNSSQSLSPPTNYLPNF